MATLTIVLNTSDGAAMADDPNEPAVILADVARLIEAGVIVEGTDRPLYDTNGGRVGTVVWA